jgi:hypothetical protein
MLKKTEKRTVERLPRAELIQLVRDAAWPDDKITEDEICEKLDIFCINCPDPCAAWDIVMESMEPLTAEEMVDLALACPPRDPKTLPEAELHWNHPFRHWELEHEKKN